jgi:hypothetical protein
MNLQRRTEARRFITMIDTFYDNKVSKWLNIWTLRQIPIVGNNIFVSGILYACWGQSSYNYNFFLCLLALCNP